MKKIYRVFIVLAFAFFFLKFAPASWAACIGPDCAANGTCPVGGNCSIIADSCVPATPTITSIVEGDTNGGATIQTRSIKINWTFSGTWGSGAGCGSTSNQFIISVIGPPSQTIYLPLVSNPSICSGTSCSYTTGPILTTNRTYAVTVSAYNGYVNSCSAAVNATKVSYPDGTISGSDSERDSGGTPACFGAPASTPPIIITANNGMSGFTYTCSGTSILTCTITLNNTSADPIPNTTYTISLDPSSALYGSISCGASCATAGSCNSITLNLDANTNSGVTSSSQTFYVNYRANLSYFKLKNQSFNGRGFLSSPFPASTQAFDTDDVAALKYLIIGTSAGSYNTVGVVTSSGGAPTLGTATGVSPRTWSNSSYALSTSAPASRFMTYTTSRKSFTQVTSNSTSAHPTPTPPSISSTSSSSLFAALGNIFRTFFGKTDHDKSTSTLLAAQDLTATPEVLATVSSLPNNPTGTYYINGDFVIDNTEAAKLTGTTNAVIVVSGKLAINANLSSLVNLALIANNIYIHENVSEVRALLSANTIYLVSENLAGTSTNSTTPLKIIGTLSSGTQIDMARRVRADNTKPSVFVVGPTSTIYRALLPNLSITRLDWRNIQ